MLVQKLITEIPSQIFNPSVAEIESVDWSSIQDPSRKGNPVFATSTAIHLRIHKVDPARPPKTLTDYVSIVECEDNPLKIAEFPATYNLAKWVMQQVNGVELGRIMIVRLDAGGVVGMHIDPGAYFSEYSRYHVPLRTNSKVWFGNDEGAREHMPYQSLCRLNNRALHMLQNDSDDYRVHLIVDIATPGGNQVF